MSKNLFDDFNQVSAKQWKQKIQFDLKGADYNETLIWHINEDIAVKPFYHADDFSKYPEVTHKETKGWKICQSIFVTDARKANSKAIHAIKRGAESIKFIIPDDTHSTLDLIQNINLKLTPIYLELQFLSEVFVKNIGKSINNEKIQIEIDIIENLAKTGNWFKNIKDDFQKLESVIKETNSITINTSTYQNGGATIVQQLAYALAHANEYLNYFKTNNQKIQTLKTTFNVAVGTNYFFEIAKLRALRQLWNILSSEYNINSNCYITVTPTKRNKTLYDYTTNILRTTTECMSAILGGADTIYNLAYDTIYHKDNEFGERIARNQLLILKHESYFNIVNNASDGSYYIESLTNQLAEKALSIFKNIEANGGFLHQLKAGTIQRKIKESALKEQQQFDSGTEVLLGTNKHPNVNDKMKDELELYPFVKSKTRKTLIEPIIEKRLAETLEQERLKKE
ncbi:methylmalonyl-CoA mutase subunit beta [uncultured Algibacter sp.]|uniref:methylmalonyl-CoA mutase subunit beta n=1 Tax=uncultured Algibacter sp. TaxID=298659 RepID=UPI00262C800E|nr:methylmalonyl-CoA mutase subunit beta [uncultured Algibacter sp.]